MQVESQNTTLLNVTDIFLCEESVIDDSFPGLDPNSTDIFALTLDFKTSSNFTIDDLKSDADSFAGVYSNSILNWSMVILYVLGFFINIPALGFVVVFEVTGEAGPYRTLINRLASHIISLVREQSSVSCIQFGITTDFYIDVHRLYSWLGISPQSCFRTHANDPMSI